MSSNLITDLVQVNLIKQNIKNAIINKGQVVTNFNSYSGAIENIQAGKGDIPLYENIADMQNNSANINELALVYSTNNLQGLFQYSSDDVWNIAPTGLTASNEYVTSAKFMGANGVEIGTLQVNSNLTTDQVKVKTQIYSDLSYLELDPSVTSLTSAFFNFKHVTTIPNFNTANITNMAQMFQYCTNIKEVPNFNTSKVIDMGSIFLGCWNLINVPNFDTSNVISMTSMFYGCKSIVNIPNFDTSKIYSIRQMFESCSNIINVPNFNLSNVVDMSQVFLGCYNLVNIPNWNTSKVTSMAYTFTYCYNLASIPNFNTSKVTDMTSTFSGCNNLVTVPVLNTSNVTSMYSTFYGCTNLSDVSIANITNMLPNANQLTNQYVANIGLNLARFDDDQLRILNNKGYIDAIPKPVGLTYNITYTI